MRKWTWFVVGMLLSLVSSSLFAKTMYVDPNSTDPEEPYQTWGNAAHEIDDAVDEAAAGDTIVVRQAIYQERVDMPSGVTLIGESAWTAWWASGLVLEDFLRSQARGFLFPNMPVVDGRRKGTVLLCKNLDQRTAIVGFEIVNGKAKFGGGIHCFKAEVLIGCNLLKNNEAQEQGGGLQVDKDSRATVLCNTFQRNSATIYGGGLCCREHLAIDVVACTFQENEVAQGVGGGAYVHWGNLSCDNCLFRKNRVTGGGAGRYKDIDIGMGKGGGFGARTHVPRCPASFSLRNCDFEENVCAIDGGGVSAHFVKDLSITNSNFLGNEAGDDGGGAYFTLGCTGQVVGGEQRRRFWNNRAQNNGGGLHASFYGEITVGNYEFYDNEAISGSGGGVSVRNMSMKVQDQCRIVGNFARGNGGGVFVGAMAEERKYVRIARDLGLGEEPIARLYLGYSEVHENLSNKEGGGLAILNKLGPEIGLDFEVDGCGMQQNRSKERCCCIFVSNSLRRQLPVNSIRNCVLLFHDGIGIFVESDPKRGNPAIEILGNRIYQNSGGVRVIRTRASISQNNIMENSLYGLYMSESVGVITTTHFTANSPNQIVLENKSSVTASLNPIGGSGVSERGILIDGSSSCVATQNAIFGHTVFGVEKTVGTVPTADAKSNWWGHRTGPYHPTLNRLGQGDTVSDNVSFAPWLLTPW